MIKILLLALALCAVGSGRADTVLKLGKKDRMSFGSDEQVAALKKAIATDPKGLFIAITWNKTLTERSTSYNILFYDREARRLWNSKTVEVAGSPMEAAWYGWTEVTDDKLLQQKEADGFELSGYHTGNGALPLSEKARAHFKKATARK